MNDQSDSLYGKWVRFNFDDKVYMCFYSKYLIMFLFFYNKLVLMHLQTSTKVYNIFQNSEWYIIYSYCKYLLFMIRE